MRAALSGLLFVLAGCDQTEKPQPKPHFEPGVIIGETNKSLLEMEQDDVIVRVNGTPLTRAGFDQVLFMHEALHKLNKPGAQPQEIMHILNQQRRTVVGEFITREVMLQEAARRKITPADEARAVNQPSIRALEARHKKSMDEICRSMGASGVLFRQRLEEDVMIHALRLDEFGDRMRVTDADVGEFYTKYNEYLEKCAATNALVMARGRLFREWLDAGAGEDFAALADRFSEFLHEDDPGGLWGEFTLVEIDDPAVRKAAEELPVGGVGGPFDTEEGMLLIKVLGREGGGGDSVFNTNPLKVRLARIGLRMYDDVKPGDPLPERGEVYRELVRDRMEELHGEFFPRLRAAARIEYPNGTNFWARPRR